MAVVDSRVLRQSDEAAPILHCSPPRTTLLLQSSKPPKSADLNHSSIAQKTKTKTKKKTKTKRRPETATLQDIQVGTTQEDERRRTSRQTDSLKRKSSRSRRTRKRISQPQSCHVSDKTAGPKTLTEAAAEIRRCLQNSNSTMSVPKERLPSQTAQSLKNNDRSTMGCPTNGEEKDSAATGEEGIRRQKKTKSSKRKKKQKGLDMSSKKNTKNTSKHQSDTKVQRERRRTPRKSLPKEDDNDIMAEKKESTEPSSLASPRSSLAFPDQANHRVVSSHTLRLDPIAELSASPPSKLEAYPRKSKSKPTSKNEKKKKKKKKKEKKHKKKRRKETSEGPSLKKLVQGEDWPKSQQPFTRLQLDTTSKVSNITTPAINTIKKAHEGESKNKKVQQVIPSPLHVSPKRHSAPNALSHQRVEGLSPPVTAVKSLVATVALGPAQSHPRHASRTANSKENRVDDDGVVVTSSSLRSMTTCGVSVRRRRPSWTPELWIPPLLSRSSRNILKQQHVQDDKDESVMDLLVGEPKTRPPSRKRMSWYQIEDPAPAEKSTSSRRSTWAGEATTRPSSSSSTTGAAGEDMRALSVAGGTMHMTFFLRNTRP